MATPIVRVEHLSHRYGGQQWAIRDINFEINQHGILGLLGSNGAGKSTTMNIICGVLSQTAGDVYINGVSIRDEPLEAKRHLGFLPQKPPLHPDLTVDEYLTFCAELRSVPGRQVAAAVDRAKARCGIAHFSKRLVKNLSGGYQQRVGIAQAIVHNPQFVVFDEPTNGLDPNQILEIRKLIQEIAQDHAVLISTHILSEVQAICDQIRMVEHGTMVFAGTMHEFNNYLVPDTFLVELLRPPFDQELLAVPGIVALAQLTPTRFRVRYDHHAPALLERVVALSVQRGWGLTEIQAEKSSLDAVFAQLSKAKTPASR